MASRLAWLMIGFAGVVAAGLVVADVAVQDTRGVRRGEYPFHYASPYTGLEYDYETRAGEPDGEVIAFRLQLEAGDLIGKIRAADPLTRIVLHHPDSGLQAVVDLVPSEVAGQEDVHLVFPERDEEVYFKSDEQAGDAFQVRFRKGPDCATLASTGLYLAQQEAAQRLAEDWDLSPHPPDHLGQVSVAVIFAGSLVDRVDGCGRAPDPTAGVCYFDHDEYYGCVNCCDGESKRFVIACQFGKQLICRYSWCRQLASRMCGGLQHAYLNTCVDVMCRGKDGDPGCSAEQECGTVPGSSCWVFCGITQRSVCGSCPEGKSCCAPI